MTEQKKRNRRGSAMRRAKFIRIPVGPWFKVRRYYVSVYYIGYNPIWDKRIAAAAKAKWIGSGVLCMAQPGLRDIQFSFKTKRAFDAAYERLSAIRRKFNPALIVCKEIIESAESRKYKRVKLHRRQFGRRVIRITNPGPPVIEGTISAKPRKGGKAAK